MSAKHSAGPWEAVGEPTYGSPYSYVTIKADGVTVASVGADYVTEDGDEILSPAAKANARLIAAAPDLLEALRGLMTVFPSDPIGHFGGVSRQPCPGAEVGKACNERCAQIRNALAKATES